VTDRQPLPVVAPRRRAYVIVYFADGLDIGRYGLAACAASSRAL
jgi:hypothetical protein